jgi:hypothetical protein
MAVNCLTETSKYNIVSNYNKGASKASLARLYKVSSDTIGRVIKEVTSKALTSKALDDCAAEPISLAPWPLDDNEYDDDDAGNNEFYWDDCEDYDICPEGDYESDTDDTDIQNGTSYSFILTPDSISITKIGEEVDTVNIDNTSDKFTEVYSIIIADPMLQSNLKKAFEVLCAKTHIENITNGLVKVYPMENRVTYQTEEGAVGEFSGRLVKRIIEAATNNRTKNGDNTVDHLIKFANKLALNPSYRAVNELYDFLEATDIRINEDGYVVCFKKVQSDFTDVRTGTFDNGVGQTPSIPRNMVDENSSNTCSYGLHVCSYAYLNSYAGAKIIRVLVDPADFVAIPEDYYGKDSSGMVKAKARVCKYYVKDDITNSINEFSAL